MEVILRDCLINPFIPKRNKIKYMFALLDMLILETEEEAFHFPSNSTP